MQSTSISIAFGSVILSTLALTQSCAPTDQGALSAAIEANSNVTHESVYEYDAEVTDSLPEAEKWLDSRAKFGWELVTSGANSSGYILTLRRPIGGASWLIDHANRLFAASEAQDGRDALLRAIELGWNASTILNSAAWTLVTKMNYDKRAVQLALEASERACILEAWENTNLLDTYAAALSLSGDFKRAALFQGTACRLNTDPTLEGKFKRRLERYNRNAPFDPKDK